METKDQAKQLIQQYTDEINDMKSKVDVEKIILASNKEKRKEKKGGRGRIASDDFSLMMELAQYDCDIARSEAKIAMWKNQIKLRKEEIVRLKKRK